jgi:hypothetical protein
MGRIKTILTAEFEEVFKRNWRPVVLVGDALPGFTRSIPADCIIASGEVSARESYSSRGISGWSTGSMKSQGAT